MDKTRYIIVVFHQRIPFLLQMDGKVHWNFQSHALPYKRLGSAINKAKKLCAQYQNDITCVFKTELGEELSMEDFKKWVDDEKHLAFSLKTA